MRFLIVLLLALLSARCALGQDTVAFYFAAHEDDWQLFMNPNAYHDVQKESTKVVFVYVTAGDAGDGAGTAESAHPYYLARENGAKASLQFMADARKSPVSPADSIASLSGHAIRRWHYRDTVSYFLRLPDGNMDGTGYKNTGRGTLKRLHDKAIPDITAVDGSAVYQGWGDLKDTLRTLIDEERGRAANVWINIPDTDTAKNPGDHSDHQHMAQGVLEAIADLPCINKALYLDYVVMHMRENLSAPDREIKAGTYAAMEAGMAALDQVGASDSMHRSWLGRRYVRPEPGTGNCSP
jgi:hypothetical protein